MNSVKIIAEIGVNHNGNLNLAFEMIDSAVECGADFVKFQTFKTELLVSKSAAKASYQIKNTNKNESQFEMLKKLELDEEDHYKLIEYCKSKGVIFLSSPFDIYSINFLNKLGMEIFKIPSGEITNYPYLKSVASINKPVILSTGMSNLSEVEQSIEVLLNNGLDKSKITLLHCNSDYPTKHEDVNLFVLKTLAKKFQVHVGYSDHTIGSEVAIASVALGALVIEKHFTLNKNLPGPDHKASMEPKEFKLMVQCIRNIEKSISGSGNKVPSKSELKNIPIVRKSIFLKKELVKGTVLSEEHLITLRPGTGICPMRWNEVLGMTLNKNLSQWSQLNWDDLDA